MPANFRLAMNFFLKSAEQPTKYYSYLLSVILDKTVPTIKALPIIPNMIINKRKTEETAAFDIVPVSSVIGSF